MSDFYIEDPTCWFIENHLDKPWNWNNISYNPNITMEFIEKYIDKPWHWEYILSLIHI